MSHPDEAIRNNSAKFVRDVVKHSVQVRHYYSLELFLELLLKIEFRGWNCIYV